MDENSLKNAETSKNLVELTECLTTRCKEPSMERFPVEKTQNACCRVPRKKILVSNREFHVALAGFLVQSSKVDGCAMKLFAVWLRERIFYADCYPPTTRHLEVQRIYDTKRKCFLWPHDGNGVSQRVSKCATCALSAKSLNKKRHI